MVRRLSDKPGQLVVRIYVLHITLSTVLLSQSHRYKTRYFIREFLLEDSRLLEKR